MLARACRETAFVAFQHGLVAVGVTDLSKSIGSDAYSDTVHTVYIQTGCAGEEKKKYFQTLDNSGTDTMGNYAWLHLIITKSFDIVAVFPVFFFFFNIIIDFHVISVSPVTTPPGVSVQPVHCWCIDLLRLTGLAV